MGAQAAGEALGSMSPEGFATAVWTMILGALGAPIITGLFTHKMEKLQNLMAGGKAELLPVVSGCAVAGVFAYLSMDRVFRFDSQTVAVLAGFIIMTVFSVYNKKANKKWIRNWAFTLSMFAGMLWKVLMDTAVDITCWEPDVSVPWQRLKKQWMQRVLQELFAITDVRRKNSWLENL